jgi:phosphonate transport system substrate-binding protein
VQRGWATRLVEGGKSILDAIDPALSPRFLLGSIGGLLLGLLALVIYVRSGETLKPVTVRLTGPLTMQTAASGVRVRIVVSPVWSSHESFEPYEALAQYLGKRLARGVVITQRKTQGEVIDLLTQGSVQAAVLGAGGYLDARARKLPLQALVVPVAHGHSLHRSLILVAANSPLKELSDLRGHSFAFTDADALTGYYDPLAAVGALTEPGHAFFSRTLFTYGDEESMRAVRNGSVDAAAVGSQIFDEELDKSSSWRQSVRVIRTSDAYARGPLVVPTSLSPDLRADLLACLLGMHEHAEGRLLLAAVHLQRFIEPPAGLYDSAARVVAQARATALVPP